MTRSELKVGYFPFAPGSNPYQRLFAESLERAGVCVSRIPPRKLLALQYAARQPVDLLQLDWPHDWYEGRTSLRRVFKTLMYREGLRRLRNRPVVWTAHNLGAHDAADSAREQRMIQHLVDACDGIMVLSNAAAGLLRERYIVPDSTRTLVVHHGHYMGCYPNSISRASSRSRLGISRDVHVVLSLGRLRPYKGLDRLIASFGRVARPGDVLILAGEAGSDEFAEQLTAMARAARRPEIRIEVRNELVADADLQVYFNACDVVALPFRDILSSGSLMLAMSFGCPVIAPTIASIPELVDSRACFGYDPADPDGLTSALQRAREGAGRSGLRESTMSFVAERYSWAAVGRKVRDFYRSIVA